MEPTPEDCATFTSVKCLATWANVKDTVLEQLYLEMDMEADDHWRVVAGVSGDDWVLIIASLKMPDGSAVAPAQMSKLGIMGAAGRITGGVQLRIAEERADYLANQKIQMTMTQGTAGSLTAPAPKQLGGTIALAMVIDQYNDAVVPMLNNGDLKAGYVKYMKRLGAMPEPKQDLTLKQYSGLQGLFDIGCAPYVDLASTFGPYGLRMEKKAKFQGLLMGKDGQLKPVELFGPGNYAVWKECWGPFRTGCIMLDTMDPATLDAYADHIEQYVMTYGAVAWPIIFQADVHARTENIERVRRGCETEYDMAKAMNAVHEYDPLRPWNTSFRKLILDQRFWRKEVEDPAMMLLGRIKSVPGLLSGDALTQQVYTTTTTTPTGREVSATMGAPSLVADKRPAHEPAEEGARKKRPRGDTRQHTTNNDGSMSTNRNGKRLCGDFQRGKCASARKGDIWCPKAKDTVHQCSKCLSPHHGSKDCQNASAPAPKNVKGGGKGNRR